MTNVEPAADDIEPPQPQRGRTLKERGRDVSAAQAEVEALPTMPRRILGSASLPYVLSQADGYPVVVKQFLQFCLILIYPAWVFAVLAGGALYFVLWVLRWPLRAWMKKNRPEDYEASKLK